MSYNESRINIYNKILTKRPTLEDYREYYTENPQLETVLPFQQIVNERNQFFDIVKRWANNEIEFNEDFMLKYSPTSKDKSYPFQNVGYDFMKKYESFLSRYPVKPNQSQGHDYNEFIRDSNNPNFKQTVIIIPPMLQTKKINLYRKDYDADKEKYYWTLTHYNKPFRIIDIEYLRSNERFIVEEGDIIPFVSMGQRKYINEPILTMPSVTEPEQITPSPDVTEPEQITPSPDVIEPEPEKTPSLPGLTTIIAVVGGVIVANSFINRKKGRGK